TLYSVIARLKTQQFINEYRASSSNGSRRKYYKLTEKGKIEFNEKYASIFTEKLELPVRDEITQESYSQPVKRAPKTTKKQEIESDVDEMSAKEDVLPDSDDYSSYIESASISPADTDIDFSSLDDTVKIDEQSSQEIVAIQDKKTDTFTIDDYNLKKDMEKEDELATIGVKKPTDDSLGSTVYQYGNVLNELFPKNNAVTTSTQGETTISSEKQGDLTDIYELAEKDGIKIRTSADTNRYQGSKILLNTLLLHTSFMCLAVYVALFIVLSLSVLNTVNFDLLLKSTLFIGIVPVAFLIIFLLNPKYAVKDLFRFKNVIEIALTITITTIIIVIAVANLKGLDYLNSAILFENVIFPILIATLIPIFFIIEYLLVKLNFYQTI
ncbi:MAG: helix-turn-helix transcriptional regulator, partial [Clostridia bacterium]|nr:helix-turn-helix transcriptional regulator [Clostridia bacterium]